MTITTRHIMTLMIITLLSSSSFVASQTSGNPLFGPLLTADPSAIVYKDTLYVFTGHDEGTTSFVMNSWYIFSTADMVHWTNHGIKLRAKDFSWSSGQAFAGHVAEQNGKFYWYCPVLHKTIKGSGKEGFAMGVAVANHPLGPYTDAIGSPLITDNTANSIALNIDPFVMIDNGTPYLYWGSWSACRYVKLKPTMTQLDGSVQTVTLQGFFEAPWIHKRNNTYYFSYASGYPSTTAYSTGPSITGPWTYKGIINDKIETPVISETNHQAIIEFKGNWYFIYHNTALSKAATDNNASTNNGTYERSVCIDKLEYNTDGSIKKVIRTTTGVPIIPTTSVHSKTAKTNTSGTQSFTLRALANGKYMINLPGALLSSTSLEICIYSIDGILQHKLFTNSGYNEVSLPSGTHIIRVSDGNVSYSRSVVLF
jgi:hypothetical protein